MNPYAPCLGERDPVLTIAATSQKLNGLVLKLGSSVDRAPAAGKWSAREILCHLADTEIVFAFRLRQTIAEPNHIIQPYDQDAWSRVYSQFDVQSALRVFETVRAWNLTLIQSLSAEDLARPVSHPERGTMTLRTIVETMGGHDLNHLGQVERISDLFLQ